MKRKKNLMSAEAQLLKIEQMFETLKNGEWADHFGLFDGPIAAAAEEGINRLLNEIRELHERIEYLEKQAPANDKDEKIISAVRAELRRAREKFPQNDCMMTALTEEVGELAKALMDESSDRVIKEAVQVAVMAVRVATEGDDSVINLRSRKGLDPLPRMTQAAGPLPVPDLPVVEVSFCHGLEDGWYSVRIPGHGVMTRSSADEVKKRLDELFPDAYIVQWMNKESVYDQYRPSWIS